MVTIGICICETSILLKDSSVGYEVRFDSDRPRDHGAVTFCTTGVVLQKLKTNPELKNISHVVIDEVHERDIYTDVLLGILFKLRRDGIKLIIMSASMNVESFRAYLNCPTIEVTGRLFPIEEFFLEDYIHEIPVLSGAYAGFQQPENYEHMRYIKEYGKSIGHQAYYVEHSSPMPYSFIAKVIKHVHDNQDEGAILVFLPGWEEISEVHYLLANRELNEAQENPLFLGEDAEIHLLHSQTPLEEQMLIFYPPKDNMRKIILSTNVAETSVTIEDVVYVVDCGKVNNVRYSEFHKSTALKLEWISMSSATQRSGRAGRVRPGKCWHLFTQNRMDNLQAFLDPAIKRLPLIEIVLVIKSLKLNVSTDEFLSTLIDKPHESKVQDALGNSLNSRENLNLLLSRKKTVSGLKKSWMQIDETN